MGPGSEPYVVSLKGLCQDCLVHFCRERNMIVMLNLMTPLIDHFKYKLEIGVCSASKIEFVRQEFAIM